ncbi:helix-turn-helix transcriptional regulator [Blastomonas sp.]|uniref:helix-turn-helix domain-containing protein n=1 Tax=Blastomonas sp. TaxID=1909299 RepID=UPI002625EC95|nr:helix-turn-helix transcriptional regulator [Blastomonas sp.]MDM7956590.1 helix-turn-helix transcriptional regulator [Blastomonas sp.]
MINRIRDVRKARSMTLDDVARRCDPPTTAQTIGRLETGMRTLSLDWLNRIAAALEVDSSALVSTTAATELGVVALLDADGARAPTRTERAAPPTPTDQMVAMRVTGSLGDYRSGDMLWLRRIDGGGVAAALNRDVLVPRPAGRFVFGRLIARDGERIQILPPGARTRQQVVNAPPWLAVAETLIRTL